MKIQIFPVDFFFFKHKKAKQESLKDVLSYITEMMALSHLQKLLGKYFSEIIKAQRRDEYEHMAANLKWVNSFMETRPPLWDWLH